MATLQDYINNPQLENEVTGCPVLLSSSLAQEVVIAQVAEGSKKETGFPEPTTVFYHETIAMMMAQKRDRIEELAKILHGDSMVFPIKSKGGIWANVTLGRSGAADLHIDDPTISVMHATFEIGVHEYPYVMKDMDSSNGTFVNCNRIQPYDPVHLASGDCVRFGQSIFYFLNDGNFADLIEFFRSKQ